MVSPEASSVRQAIAKKYREVARSPRGLFKYQTGEASALALGYSPVRVAAVPYAARSRFVEVGNPVALGPIGKDEHVLDLGCGAGFDAFVEAQLVGPAGRVCGVDLSPEMLAVADAARIEAAFPQVEFREAAVEALPFGDALFDVALSNGVLNLIPDKPAALREVFHVLKPGGWLQVCKWGWSGRSRRRTRLPGPTESPAPLRGRSSSPCSKLPVS